MADRSLLQESKPMKSIGKVAPYLPFCWRRRGFTWRGSWQRAAYMRALRRAYKRLEKRNA